MRWELGTRSKTAASGGHPATGSLKRKARSKLIKLDVAAKRLGCHIETLRLRIRSGRLEANRGPHGAYYIRIESLRGLLAHRRRAPIAPTEKDLELAWRSSRLRVGQELARKRITDGPRYAHVEELYKARKIKHWSTIQRLDRLPQEYQMVVPFLQALKKDPKIRPGVYRLLLGQGLAGLGFEAKQVAALFGISQRQARRLVRKREIASAVFRAARRWVPHEAGRLVAELRQQLEAEGFRFHRRTRRAWMAFHSERPRPAFIAKKLTQDEVIVLTRAGLSPEQIWAITVVGIGSDELNQLLLLGTR